MFSCSLLQLPAQSVLKAPIWTTWARYKTDVSQNKVLRYAQEIVDRGLQRSVMEIDDRWVEKAHNFFHTFLATLCSIRDGGLQCELRLQSSFWLNIRPCYPLLVYQSQTEVLTEPVRSLQLIASADGSQHTVTWILIGGNFQTPVLWCLNYMPWASASPAGSCPL